MKLSVPAAIVALAFGTMSNADGQVVSVSPLETLEASTRIVEMRQLDNVIYVHGGVFDGAAADQVATFAIAPDDHGICLFLVDGYPAQVNGYEFELANGYAELLDILLPNSGKPSDGHYENFVVEITQNGTKTSTEMSLSDPRANPMLQYLTLNRSPCWTFG
jgi:hypothetical protein